jgi:hypothetical protein
MRSAPDVDLDRCLAGAGHVDGEHRDPAPNERIAPLDCILLAAVERADGQHQRGRACRGQPQIADDLFAFEGNAYDLDRGVEEARVVAESLERHGVGLLLAGRIRYRPAGEGVIAPCFEVIGLRFPQLLFLLLALGARRVPPANRAESCRPFVTVEAVHLLERLAYVVGLESGERIGIALGAGERLGFELLERARRCDLRGCRRGREQQGCRCQQTARITTREHGNPPVIDFASLPRRP